MLLNRWNIIDQAERITASVYALATNTQNHSYNQSNDFYVPVKLLCRIICFYASANTQNHCFLRSGCTTMWKCTELNQLSAMKTPRWTWLICWCLCYVHWCCEFVQNKYSAHALLCHAGIYNHAAINIGMSGVRLSNNLMLLTWKDFNCF